MSTTTRKISNQDDVIDSRDVIDRLEHLASRWMAHVNGEGEQWDDDDNEELRTLTEFADEAEEYAEDWIYGTTLIHDGYFLAYAQELADDIGAGPRDADWPVSYIDWDAAANALKMDYSAVDFAGQTYWVR